MSTCTSFASRPGHGFFDKRACRVDKAGGVAALKEVVAADAKRGEVGNTPALYPPAAFEITTSKGRQRSGNINVDRSPGGCTSTVEGESEAGNKLGVEAAAEFGGSGSGGAACQSPTRKAAEPEEKNLKASHAESAATLRPALHNDLPLPQQTTREEILTTSLGPGPKTYFSEAHGVEFELQTGSLDEELPLKMTITPSLAFVECRARGSGRGPLHDDAATEEYLAMTFVHGPEGVTFPAEKPAMLRFCLGCVDETAPAGDDDSDQVAISDEEVERDILKAYRPLSSPNGVENWAKLGPYSVVFRRLHDQREVWVEAPVYHFSVTANAMRVDRRRGNQPYYHGDLDGSRWSRWCFKSRWRFKDSRSAATRVRFGNATKANCATFTSTGRRHLRHQVDTERGVEVGEVGAIVAGGERRPSPAVGGAVTTIVSCGTYEDCDMPFTLQKHPQMKVRVGVFERLSGPGAGSNWRLQLLDDYRVSGNRILVLHERRLELPIQFSAIDWPCSAEDIFGTVVTRF